jgi:hypothetical protein
LLSNISKEIVFWRKKVFGDVAGESTAGGAAFEVFNLEGAYHASNPEMNY